MKKNSVFLAVPTFFLSLPAFAHSGHAEHTSTSLMAGFIHPFTGLDHLAAMTLLGFVLAAYRFRHAAAGLVAALVAFIGALMVGALLPLWAPLAEVVSLGSVIVFAILMVKKLPMNRYLLGLVAFAMAGHGMAHGAELTLSMGAQSSVALFAVGAASALTLLAVAAMAVFKGVLAFEKKMRKITKPI